MKYVIIGNSAAAIGAVEGIRQIDAASPIVLISKEPHHTYSRPLISYLLWGKTDERRMKYRPDDFYEVNHVQALLALGCHLCRTCQAGKCNWGIATQRPELVKRLNPEIGYQRLVNLVTAWNHEIMEMMGGMGINSIESMRGNRLMLRGIGLTDRELAILGVKHAGE